MSIERVPTGNGPALRTTSGTRERPERPSLATANHAPVVARVPPPFSVRLSQLAWVLSIATGAFGIVYAFIVRTSQVELLTERVRGLATDRPDEVLTTTAEIVYWCLFGALVLVVLVQIVSGVSFSGRRPMARWWMLGALLLLALVLGFGFELTEPGSEAAPLPLVIALQGALGIVALLFAVLPGAIRWTARGVDIRRGPAGSPAASGDL